MLDPASGSKNQFAAYDIKAFTDLDRFKDTMDEMLRTLRTAAPAPGQERVLYPGLSEAEEVEHRRAHGIPLTHAHAAAPDAHAAARLWAIYRDEIAGRNIPVLQVVILAVSLAAMWAKVRTWSTPQMSVTPRPSRA